MRRWWQRQRRRWWWLSLAVIILLMLAGGGFALVLGGRAPALSGVGERACVAGSAATCLTFPAISGANLPGRPFDLPADFAGRLNLVLVPFDEDQQVKAQTWLPLAHDLAAADPDLVAYNVPVFPSLNAPMRTVIRMGMNVTIPDAALQAVTITVFLDDRDAFLAALDIPAADVMQVFLLDDAGVVLWRGAGEFSSPQGEALRAVVARFSSG